MFEPKSFYRARCFGVFNRLILGRGLSCKLKIIEAKLAIQAGKNLSYLKLKVRFKECSRNKPFIGASVKKKKRRLVKIMEKIGILQ